MRKMVYVEKKASERKPPTRANRKDVAMKALTSLAALDSGKCMNFVRYKTKLLAFAKKARFSNTSTASQHTHKRTKRRKSKQKKSVT